MMISARLRAIAAVLAVTATMPIAAAASASDASPWSEDQNAAVRLLAGTTSPEGYVRAGVEIKLAPGWHTYWRYPGDAGIPPQFDFTGSENVASVDVRYPAPQRIDADGLTSIGYQGDVVLPLHVTPKQAGAPIRLELKVSYAVCEKLCVPAQGAASLTLDGASGREDRLKAAEARVPAPAQLDQTPGAHHGLAIRSVSRQPGQDHPRVLVDVAAPQGQSVALFAEGPTPDWALPVPKPVPGGPQGTQRFAFDLDGLPPGQTMPDVVPLRLTAVAGDTAIEVRTDLD